MVKFFKDTFHFDFSYLDIYSYIKSFSQMEFLSLSNLLALFLIILYVDRIIVIHLGDSKFKKYGLQNRHTIKKKFLLLRWDISQGN